MLHKSRKGVGRALNIPEGKGKCAADTKPPDNRGEVDTRLYGAEPRGDTAKAGDVREGVSHFVTITNRPHIRGKHEYPVRERRTRKGGSP